MTKHHTTYLSVMTTPELKERLMRAADSQRRGMSKMIRQWLLEALEIWDESFGDEPVPKDKKFRIWLTDDEAKKLEAQGHDLRRW